MDEVTANGSPSDRGENGKFRVGNTAARQKSDGQKRLTPRQVVNREVTEEGLAQAIRVVMGTASDPRKPTIQLKAAELIFRVSGLLQPHVSLEVSSGESIEDRRLAINARLDELLAQEAEKQAMSGQGA